MTAPAELRTSAVESQAASTRAPADAAACVQRNAAEYHATAQAQIYPDGAAREVFVYIAGGFGQMLAALVRAEPAPTGSRLEVRLQPIIMDRSNFAAALLKGC